MAATTADLAQLRNELRGTYVTSVSVEKPPTVNGDLCFQGTYLEAFLERSESNMKHQHIWRATLGESGKIFMNDRLLPLATSFTLTYESTLYEFLVKKREVMMIGYSCARWALLNGHNVLAKLLLQQVQPEIFLVRLTFEGNSDMTRFVLDTPHQLPITKDTLDDLLDSTDDPELRARLMAMGATEMPKSPPMTPEVPEINEDLFDYEYMEYCWRNEFREDQKLSTKHAKRLAGCACFFCRECTFV